MTSPSLPNDNISRTMKPLVPWMKEEKDAFLGPEWVFRTELEMLSRYNHPVKLSPRREGQDQWKDDPVWSQRNKDYLRTTCMKLLWNTCPTGRSTQ
ncbi:hypothetical protein E2320_014281, partial [Naja naja]